MSRRGEGIRKSTEVDTEMRLCTEKRGETEIEKVVGSARRGKAEKKKSTTE